MISRKEDLESSKTFIMKLLSRYQKKFVESLNIKWFGLYQSTVVLAIMSLFFLGIACAYYFYWVQYTENFCQSQANTTLSAFCSQGAGEYFEKVVSLYGGAIRSGTAAFFLGLLAVSDHITKSIAASIVQVDEESHK